MPDDPQTPPEQPSTPQGGADVLTGLQRLIERQSGDAGRVAELLYRENYDLRERVRQLGSQIPPQGAIVLQPDQAAHWQAYQQLGEPSALQQALEARQQAEQRLASLERETTLRQIAEASGFRASVLGRLADGLTLEVRDGAPVVVNGETATPLAEYAQREWADFLPALTQASGSQGTAFVRQQPGPGATAATGIHATVEGFQKARDARPNPFAS